MSTAKLLAAASVIAASNAVSAANANFATTKANITKAFGKPSDDDDDYASWTYNIQGTDFYILVTLDAERPDRMKLQYYFQLGERGSNYPISSDSAQSGDGDALVHILHGALSKFQGMLNDVAKKVGGVVSKLA